MCGRPAQPSGTQSHAALPRIAAADWRSPGPGACKGSETTPPAVSAHLCFNLGFRVSDTIYFRSGSISSVFCLYTLQASPTPGAPSLRSPLYKGSEKGVARRSAVVVTLASTSSSSSGWGDRGPKSLSSSAGPELARSPHSQVNRRESSAPKPRPSLSERSGFAKGADITC